MPELPEVEIIKLGLEKKIIGLTIQKIQVLSPKSFLGNPKLVEGQKVFKIWRRAKMLGIDLRLVSPGETRSSTLRDESSGLRLEENLKIKKESGDSSATPQNDKGLTLLFHLKMSGQLIYEDEKRFIGGHPTEDMLGKMPNSHTRVIFSFSDPLRPSDSEASGSHLYFNDQRKFGWVKVVDREQVPTRSRTLGETGGTGDSVLKNLGPEPLEKEFTWQILKSNLLKHKSQPVKVAIMDQSVVSGVGNIYANEACFLAKIDPRTKVTTLTDDQFQALYRGVVGALREGIKYKGSTRAHFVDAQGRKGYFLDYAKVYWKEGYPCQGCAGKVQKITLGGRGTYFCSKCQT